jgi:hypothetical protein
MRTAGVNRLKISTHPTGNRTRNLPSVHRIKIRMNGYEILMSRDEQTRRNFGAGCLMCREICLVCCEICLVCHEIV